MKCQYEVEPVKPDNEWFLKIRKCDCTGRFKTYMHVPQGRCISTEASSYTLKACVGGLEKYMTKLIGSNSSEDIAKTLVHLLKDEPEICSYIAEDKSVSFCKKLTASTCVGISLKLGLSKEKYADLKQICTQNNLDIFCSKDKIRNEVAKRRVNTTFETKLVKLLEGDKKQANTKLIHLLQLSAICVTMLKKSGKTYLSMVKLLIILVSITKYGWQIVLTKVQLQQKYAIFLSMLV